MAGKSTPSTPTGTVVNYCNVTSILSTTAAGTLLWSTNETTLTITVSAANSYTVTQTLNSCVSAVGSGVATPKTSSTGDTTATACGSFVWYSNTYTSSSTPTHTFTNVSGCDSVVTLHLTIAPNLPASVIITSTGNTICAGTSVTFTATPTNGGTDPAYQWKLNGNNVGTNSTTYINSSLVNADVVTVVMTSNDLSVATIGTQLWTNKNLNVATYRNGETIPKVENGADWATLTTGAYCYFNNDSTTYAALYGKLYNWYAVHDTLHGGLAPTGWHVSTDAEWTILTTSLGANPGTQLKATSGWNNSGNGSNSSGFACLPGAARRNTGVFGSVGTNGNWWSWTENNSTTSWFRALASASSNVNRSNTNKRDGLAVRLVKDVSSLCVINLPAISNAMSITVNQCNTTLNVKAYLEGFYRDNGMMSSTLYDIGNSDDPTATDTITVNLWSPVSLGNDSPNYSVHTILHTNGTASVQFPGATLGNSYYVAIKHRNSIEIWSAEPVTIASEGSYDFSTSFSSVYSDGFNDAMKSVSGGKYALYGGDVNQDGTVDLYDAQTADNGSANLLFGYDASDCNGDGSTDLFDLQLIENNGTLFIFTSRPY